MEGKLCTKCARLLPRDAFRPRPERGPNALHSWCRECLNAHRQSRRVSATPDEKERALALARQWKRNNRERNKAAKRAWEAANHEKVKAYTQRVQRKWRAANIELARERVLASKRKKPDYYREQQRQAQKRDAHKYRAKYKEYMATKRGATPPWFDKVLVEEAYHLAQLRTRATGFQWHVDHVVPLQSPIVCGLHTIENLQVIPGVLNLSKSNRFWPGMPGEENR